MILFHGLNRTGLVNHLEQEQFIRIQAQARFRVSPKNNGLAPDPLEDLVVGYPELETIT